MLKFLSWWWKLGSAGEIGEVIACSNMIYEDLQTQ